MSAGPVKVPRAPALPKRSRWLTFAPQQPTLEEACRRTHAFASRFPSLYRLRVTLSTVLLPVAPIFAVAFLTLVTLAFPWASAETDLLQPLNSEPVLRWAMIGFVYALLLPLVGRSFAGVLRGFTLRLPVISGRRLAEAEAPRIFTLLKEMSRSLDAPAVDEVVVSADRILEIRREPSGGLAAIGRARTTLVVGLPMVEELSPQHFRALLAHEMAHLSTHKRRFGGRVLALRLRLAAMRQAAEEIALDGGYWSGIPGESLLETLDRTIARLTAVTFPAVRQHEAEADAIAATLAGRDYAASALLRQRMAGHAFGHQFQAECMRLAETQSEIPADLFDRRAAMACGAISEIQVNAWLRVELEVKDNLAESHPPLWDRLRLLGFGVDNITDFRDLLELVQPHRELGETAARYFLGEAAETLRAEFFQEWAAHQAADWRKRCSVYESLRATAAEWDNAGAPAEANAAGLWQTAVAVGNTQGWKAALPVAQRVLEISPDHADANLLAGQLMMEEGNRAGVDALERAMRSDARVTPVACTLAARFLEGRGERDLAAQYQKRGAEYRKQEQAIAQERSRVRSTDSFSTADCSAATAAALGQAVARHSSQVRAAFLMRKTLPAGDQKPLYVLGVERRGFIYENAALANRLLLERIMRTQGIPGDVLVCVVTRANRALLNKWKGVPDGIVYPGGPAAGAVAASAQQTAGAGLLREPAGAAMPARSSPATAK